MLDSTQPYKGGAGEILSNLNALNNTDKHRLLLTCGLPFPAVELGEGFLETLVRVNPTLLNEITSQEPAQRKPLIVRPEVPGHLKAGDVLLRTTMHSELDQHVNLTFAVALDEPGVFPQPTPVIELLEEFLNAVRGLIPRFESYV